MINRIKEVKRLKMAFAMYLRSLRWVCLLGMLLVLGACLSTGPSVQVSNVQEPQIKGLEKEEKAKLEKLIKDRSLKSDQDYNLPESFKKAEKSISAKEYVQSNRFGSSGDDDYIVGADDTLHIDVFEEEDLSREAVKVTSEGLIHFPLIGRVKVEGMTTSQIEDLLAAKLAYEQYLVDPHISVSVEEYLSKDILVLGAVRNPGRYYLKGNESLLDLISRAGGVDFSEGGHKVTIIREEDQEQGQNRQIAININLRRLLDGYDQYANLSLQGDDVIFVPKAEKIYVMGEVQEPGDYVLTDKKITLVEAISMAGGFTRIAARNRTKIVRIENGEKKVYQVRVQDLTNEDQSAHKLTLKPNDVIIIPESFF
jgi:polysaccharide export outer membrane protein